MLTQMNCQIQKEASPCGHCLYLCMYSCMHDSMEGVIIIDKKMIISSRTRANDIPSQAKKTT